MVDDGWRRCSSEYREERRARRLACTLPLPRHLEERGCVCAGRWEWHRRWASSLTTNRLLGAGTTTRCSSISAAKTGAHAELVRAVDDGIARLRTYGRLRTRAVLVPAARSCARGATTKPPTCLRSPQDPRRYASIVGRQMVDESPRARCAARGGKRVLHVRRPRRRAA